MNIYENARRSSPKIKVVIGPFGHTMPEYSQHIPSAAYDGKAEMVRWFSYWLKDDDQYRDIIDEPDITLFIRTSLTTGSYRYELEWPIARGQTHRMILSSGQRLLDQIEEIKKDSIDVDTLQYKQWIGFEAEDWWGVSFRDQSLFDQDCLIYNSDPVNRTLEIAGFVNVSLQVVHDDAICTYFIDFMYFSVISCDKDYTFL
jgi:predicted acyl esterase